MRSSGRLCQAVTSATMPSVTVLIKSGETSTSYISARKPWISRTVIPRAYSARTLSSKPVKRRSCLAISRGAKLPSRSRGTSSARGPSSVSTVLAPVPLRGFDVSSGFSTQRVAEMVRQLAAERAFDDRFLEPTDRGIELLGRDRALPDELIENFGGNRRQR